jgi:hypothetical protein
MTPPQNEPSVIRVETTIPKSVVLDNSAVNRFADLAGRWTETKLAQLLLSLRHTNTALVWANPTNVIEIVLCPDLQKRQTMAIALNNLIEGRRMMPSYTDIMVEDFCRALEDHWPGSIKGWSAIKNEANSTAQLYLGLLGQLAALVNYQPGPFDEIIRCKLETTYIQSEFVKDPDQMLRIYDPCIEEKQLDQVFHQKLLEVKRLPLVELKQRIESNLKQPKKLSSINKFQQKKYDLAEFYARYEAAKAFDATFKYAEQMLATFALTVVVKNWEKRNPQLGDRERFEPLDKVLQKAFLEEEDRAAHLKYCGRILDKLIGRYGANGFIPIPNLMMDVYVNELERTLRDPKSVSEGLVLDMDYVAAVLKADVFLTFDDKLAATLKTRLQRIKINDSKNRVVVTSTEELQRYLQA